MAGSYRNGKDRMERDSSVTGIVLTVAVHLCILGAGLSGGLTYIYPPPEEESILLDFSEDIESPVIREMSGEEPRAVKPDPQREVELVQRSEGQVEGHKANEAMEATTGDDGDVEVPEPPRKKEINRRALFHAASNRAQKDTLAPQTAAEPTDELKAGHASGTAENGKEIGVPKARLKGRSPVNGYLPAPEYPVQKAGTVVVNIKVDNYGNVTGQPSINMEETNVTDQELWQAAINAAKKTKFNRTLDAPPLQEGTITYIFRLK
jgi:TonB family protein